MSMSKSMARRHALAMVRRAVRRGTATDADLERWAEELGAEVFAIADRGSLELTAEPEDLTTPEAEPQED